MPFPYAEICTLFQRIEAIELREPPLLPDERTQKTRAIVDSWFKSHRSAISALTVEGATALLSTLLPEKRTDRVYGIQAPGLCRILARCLKLQAHRAKDLRAYTQPGRGDLAACLERVLNTGGPPAMPIVTLEEVDDLLATLARYSIFSDPSILQVPSGSSEARDTLLANILKRTKPEEAKWLLRLVLKDLSPLKVDEAHILKSFHFLLPDLLRFQATFSSAVGLLKGPLKEYPDRPDYRSERLLRNQAASSIKPCVGNKVGRPQFTKARSIDHCLKMLAGQQWVLERKYDGEYCEIHIDLSMPAPQWIKIFSKSGKNSTADRQGIHKTLTRCLRLGRPECKIKKRAIILGELFVWSDQERAPMPFETMRKYVLRSGVRIGADADSQRHPEEHLAIAFFDLLLLDDEVVMTKPIEERRQWLREVYTKIEGRAMGAQWKVVDFADKERSRKVLLQQFAASNAGRCEGLVLKPCSLPYFALHSNADGFKHGFIKLKSDYISEMGDEADFAVIGASYNAEQGLKSGVERLKWTDFVLGCLTNKEDVLRFGTRPRFQLVGMFQQAFCIPKPILQTANIIGNLSAEPYDPQIQPSQFDLINPMGAKVDTIFNSPLVFEVLGAGFQKPSNCKFYMLRHARVKKLHQDRSWKDCVSFQELQEQAMTSRSAAVDSESQETRRWIERLERKCRRKLEREKTVTPKSAATRDSINESGGANPRSSLSIGRLSMTYLPDTRLPLKTVQNNSVQPIPAVPLNNAAITSVLDTTVSVDEQLATGVKRKLDDTASTPCPMPKRPCGTAPPPISTMERKLAHLTATHRCHTECLVSCTLSNTTVYLSPCFRYTPYITQTLLATHSPIAVVPCLSHWNRASFTHDHMSSTVSESQAYPGMGKVVLVESKREEATEDAIRQLLALNEGQFRERVEVWDWRVLEELSGHVVASTGRRWFLGATILNDGKAVFVWNRSWV
jgi:DNA ligase-4